MALPAQILSAVEPFCEANMNFDNLKAFLLSQEATALSHSDLERELEEKGRELLRTLLQAHLDQRGPGEVVEPVRDAEGTPRSKTRLHTRALGSVFGAVEVSRTGYGGAGLESLHPLDAELNLPVERYSHELRRRCAVEASRGSFDEAVESVSNQSGTKVPKRQVEELVVRAATDFESYYERQNGSGSAPSEGSLLVLSFDGKGVAMLPKDLREPTRKAAEERRHKLGKRLSKGEKRHAKRMATVAAVYTVAPHIREPEQVARVLAPIHVVEDVKRPKPENKRVWASLEKTPEEVIEQAFEEAQRRDPSHEKSWVALVDGNKTQLKILSKMAKKNGVAVTVVLDLIHVTEYLWTASTAFHDEESREREDWVSERLLRILRGQSSAVAGGIRRSATLRELDGKARQAVDRCCDYLLRHASYLRYDQYLTMGLPIATGVIEGACRHLVKDRMELTGARWSLAGAEAVLRLRALRKSGDFEKYWGFHEAQEYERNHAVRYAGAQVPKTEKARPQGQKPHLRLVK
jgi:hypothetical protein